MLYLRVAATAAVILSLAGCSFFDFLLGPETPKADRQSTAVPGPAQAPQLAALPKYQSDRDVAPDKTTEIRGFVGSPPRRPERAVAAVQAAPAVPVKRRLTFKDLLPARPVLDLQPMPAAFEPSSHSLADLIADQDWRKRTSESLNRLFQ